MKKRILSILLILCLLFNCFGCGSRKKEKIKITMYLWDKPMMKELTPWLEEQFPCIDFSFIVGYNSMDYFINLNEREALPDIITCRRFSLKDAAKLSDYLLDLSETNIVGSFYDGYINNYREQDGDIRWLPIGAEVDGYIANVDLFNKYNIPIPTNQNEFADAIRQFEQYGIRGYINDYVMDYSCMEALQGSSIPELMSYNGTMWRFNYENQLNDNDSATDDNVWPKVFDNFEKYLSDTLVNETDLKISYIQKFDSVKTGKCAVMRGTAEDCILLRNRNVNAVMLPYYGETEDDNWVLTYPMFQVAVNNEVSKDSAKKKAVMQVLNAMFSAEGREHAAAGNAVLSYSKNVDFKMNEVFSYLKDSIDSNRLYMRLASSEMFSVSKDVVTKMITKEYDAKTAYEDFNKQITDKKRKESDEIYMTQEEGYDYSFEDTGIPAASSVINTIRRQTKDDIVIGFSNVVTSQVFAGDYTKKQLSWLISNWCEIKSKELKGSEVKIIMEWLINTKENGSNPVKHKNLLPVTSGMRYIVSENRDGSYKLEKLIIDEEQIKDDKVYHISIVGDVSFIEQAYYCNCPMPEELKDSMVKSEISVYELFIKALGNGEQIAKPTDYVKIKK